MRNTKNHYIANVEMNFLDLEIGYRKHVFASILCFAVLLTMGNYIPAVDDARELVRKADEKLRGKTAFVEMTIQTIRPSWNRELKLKSWSKDTHYSLIFISAPAKEKGVVFLKRNKEIWNWVPSIERTIKLPPSMMTQSWMGTDFNNDDLLKESSMVDDYTHTFAGDSVIQGRSCRKIRMIPKPDAAVVWGMIITWIDNADYLQMRAEFYDEEEVLVNTLQSFDVKMLGGRLLPSRMEMVPADKKGHKTVMIYESIQFDAPIKDEFFTLQNIKNVK